MRKVVAFAVVIVTSLAACGGGGGGSSSGNAPVKKGAREIDVTAQNYSFTPSSLDVTSSENVAVVLHSKDQTHDFAIQGKGVIVEVDGGKTAKGGFQLTKPGKYTFYCSIPGHRAAGMVGSITVT
jgi:nitrite reductase (NO-forming)